MPSKHAASCLAVVLLFVAGAAHAILPIQHWQTAGGAQVFFVENHDLPMVDLSVEFPAGSAYDSKAKSGAAGMTQRLLSLGADGMNEDDIARGLADVGAQLSGTFNTDRAGLSMRTLSSSEERRRALDIFARLLQRPVFQEEVMAREKARLVAALNEADTKPDTIAGKEFYRLVYRDHPYALRGTGEVATVQQLSRQDLIDFHRRHYLAPRAVVALVGDLRREDAARIAEQLTAGLPRDGGAALDLPAVTPLPATETHFVAHPATQSHIMIGAPGITRHDADYFPLVVGNHVLGGGGFVSRLTEEVRTKRGLAYSAYSYFTPLLRQGPFLIGMQTKREQAQEALEVVRAILREFVARGPTEEELSAAKKNIIGGFPLRIDSNRDIHGYLAIIGFYRLPLTYLDDYVKNVEKVTVAQIKDAFARRIDPERMATVVVGAVKPGTAASPAGN
jgi:zinc protease